MRCSVLGSEPRAERARRYWAIPCEDGGIKQGASIEFRVRSMGN